MRKKAYFTIALFAAALAGCSTVHKNVEKHVQEKARENITLYSDADYQEFQKHAQNGEVVNGYYAPNGVAIDLEDITETAPNGIKVSFSNNNHLSIHYYQDAEKSIRVDDSAIWLKEDSHIFADVKVANTVNTNQYHFSKFRIYEFDSEGAKRLLQEVPIKDNGEVLYIPVGASYKELLIEPVGKYEDRVLSFTDYYFDSSKMRHELSGVWTVNDKEATSGTLAISPVQQYMVSYEYDKDKYFFVSSEPNSHYVDDTIGKVIFKQSNPNDGIENYSVELAEYMTSNIRLASGGKVDKQGEIIEVKKNGTYTATQLRFGDKIRVETNNEDPEYDKSVFQCDKETDNVYILTVVEGKGDFCFDPSLYHYEHGEIVFTYSGNELTNKTYLSKGRVIGYYAKNVDDGYWLPDGKHSIVIEDSTATETKIRSIQFYPHEQVTVNLPQPDCGGKILYWVNGKEQKQESVVCYCGTTIEMQLDAWNGWQRNSDVVYYTVNSGEKIQTANINGIDVSHAFEENTKHKPTLTVKLDKSVGDNMSFDVSTFGGTQTGLTFTTGDIIDRITGTKKVYESSIGTAKGITISAAQDEIRTGTVLKIQVVKTDTADKATKTNQIYYIEELPGKVVIPVYDSTEIANCPVYYKTVEITISVVDKYEYKPVAVGNAAIVLSAIDVEGSPVIYAGEIMDNDREIRVQIKPNQGYYVTGNSVKNDQCVKEMSFKDYQSDIESIIIKHPVKKEFVVLLDCTDDFGNVQYLLDGVPTSGTVRIRDGQKLTLRYSITNSDYAIVRDTSGVINFVKNVFTNEKDISVKIDISPELDGATISRADYIEIRKVG